MGVQIVSNSQNTVLTENSGNMCINANLHKSNLAFMPVDYILTLSYNIYNMMEVLRGLVI